MRKLENLDIIVVALLSLACLIFILTPKLNETIIRIVLGVLLLLFLPGYSLTTTLFPKKNDLDGIERIFLSVVLSISVAPLIALVLNYTSFGINLIPIIISLSVFTILMCTCTYIRRLKMLDKEKYILNFKYSGLLNSFKTNFRFNKILLSILIILIVLSFSMVIYMVVNPNEGESFTEFYMLDSNGKVSDYPTNLTFGETGYLQMVIVNHEHVNTSYEIIVTSNQNKVSDLNVTVDNEQRLVIPYNFTMVTSEKKEIKFLLYKKPDDVNIYRNLTLWVNVI